MNSILIFRYQSLLKLTFEELSLSSVCASSASWTSVSLLAFSNLNEDANVEANTVGFSNDRTD